MNKQISKLTLLATLGMSASVALAQVPNNDGYLFDTRGVVARSGFGLCWKTTRWTPAMAIAECDPDLVKKPDAPKPAAPAATPKPAAQKVTLAADALFDFDKAVLRPEGRAAIDSEIIAKLPQVQKLELVLVTGHTDRIGTQQYNQRLSERRADAVRDYLVSKGVPKDRIETLGMGKTQPVPGVSCNQKNMKELIACLQPNRRVEVEVKGEAVKK